MELVTSTIKGSFRKLIKLENEPFNNGVEKLLLAEPIHYLSKVNENKIDNNLINLVKEKTFHGSSIIVRDIVDFTPNFKMRNHSSPVKYDYTMSLGNFIYTYSTHYNKDFFSSVCLARLIEFEILEKCESDLTVFINKTRIKDDKKEKCIELTRSKQIELSNIKNKKQRYSLILKAMVDENILSKIDIKRILIELLEDELFLYIVNDKGFLGKGNNDVYKLLDI